MRLSFIGVHIEHYKNKMGTVRWITGVESHIAELDNFYSKAIDERKKKQSREDTLTSLEMLELVEIILRKKDLKGIKRSSKIFIQLVNELGGEVVLNALKTLQDNNCLNEITVQLILNNAIGDNLGYINDLALFIIFVIKDMYRDSEKNFNENLEILVDMAVEFLTPLKDKEAKQTPLVDKMDNIKALRNVSGFKPEFLTRKVFLAFLNYGTAFVLKEIIGSLIELGLMSDGMIGALPEEQVNCSGNDPLSSLNTILWTLKGINKELINQSNFMSICKLGKNIENFFQIINKLALLQGITEERFGKFLKHPSALKSLWHPSIIERFYAAKWNFDDYLEPILLIEYKDAIGIEEATKKLLSLKLPKPLNIAVIDVLLKHPQHHYSIMAAVTKLHKENLLDNCLESALSSPEYADIMADFLVEQKLVTDQGKGKEKEQNDKVIIPDLLAKHPEYADKVAEIMKCLRLQNLANENNIKQIYEKDLTTPQSALLIGLLQLKGLLTQANFERVLAHRAYLKTISSASACLSNGDKLTQETFERLFDNPPHAMTIAAISGGKRHHHKDPKNKSLEDKGAKDFLDIRNFAYIMAQARRQNTFFHSPSENLKEKQKEPEKRAIAEKTQPKPTKNQRRKAKKEKEAVPSIALTNPKSIALANPKAPNIVLNIARFIGDGHLEEETAKLIFEDAYSATLCPNL